VQYPAQERVLTRDFDIASEMHLNPTNVHYQEGGTSSGREAKYTWNLTK
jgi:hypothetical protein